MRAHVFSEFTPFDALTSRETTRALARAKLAVYVALQPSQRDRAGVVIGRLRDAGVEVGLWPLLENRDGRWANVWNGARFAAFCRGLFDELDAVDLLPDELLIDLEPPIDGIKRLLDRRLPRRRPADPDGRGQLASLTREVSAAMPVVATVAPFVCGRGGRGWQRALGTPLDGLTLERIYVMAYTSMFEGLGRGAGLVRADAEALLGVWGRGAVDAFGHRAGIAVGVVGTGALGDERTYRGAAELARDVAIARASGCGNLALFNLRGVLERRDPEAWLEALAAPAGEPPPPRLRVRMLLGTFAGVGQAIELAGLSYGAAVARRSSP